MDRAAPGATHSQEGKGPPFPPCGPSCLQAPSSLATRFLGLEWGLSQQRHPLNSHSSGQLPLRYCVPLTTLGYQLEKVSDPEPAPSPLIGNKTKLSSWLCLEDQHVVTLK